MHIRFKWGSCDIILLKLHLLDYFIFLLKLFLQFFIKFNFLAQCFEVSGLPIRRFLSIFQLIKLSFITFTFSLGVVQILIFQSQLSFVISITRRLSIFVLKHSGDYLIDNIIHESTFYGYWWSSKNILCHRQRVFGIKF